MSILIMVELSFTGYQGHPYLQHAQLCGVLPTKVLHAGEC